MWEVGENWSERKYIAVVSIVGLLALAGGLLGWWLIWDYLKHHLR